MHTPRPQNKNKNRKNWQLESQYINITLYIFYMYEDIHNDCKQNYLMSYKMENQTKN